MTPDEENIFCDVSGVVSLSAMAPVWSSVLMLTILNPFLLVRENSRTLDPILVRDYSIF
jgi:hypothetical protein